jgi:hypothetical protein
MSENLTRVEFAECMKDLKLELEETRSLIRLSLQELQTGRETTERGFADVRRESHQLRALLESRLTHVSHRVDRMDRRG